MGSTVLEISQSHPSSISRVFLSFDVIFFIRVKKMIGGLIPYHARNRLIHNFGMDILLLKETDRNFISAVTGAVARVERICGKQK